MVARGDLGIEVPIEEIPQIQKRLLRLAGRYSKPCITATQMLASMVRSTRPTRAEATDVANAVYDGTDALMLSEETAIGQHPIEAVRMMSRIAEVTERDLPYDEWLAHAHAPCRARRRRHALLQRGRRRVPARPRRARRTDAQRAHRAAGLGASPAGARARPVGASRHRAAAAAAVRRDGPRITTSRHPRRPARGLRAERAATWASPSRAT